MISVSRLFFACVLFGVLPLKAQWVPNLEKAAEVIKDTYNPVNISVQEKPSGGAFVVWQDNEVSGTVIRLQSVDGGGRALLKPGGIEISTLRGYNEDPLVKVAPNGFAYILWQHTDDSSAKTKTRLLLQKVKSDGSMQLGPEGIQVTPDVSAIVHFSFTLDDKNNVVISYIERGGGGAQNSYILRMQRLSSSGYLDYGDAGVVVDSSANNKKFPSVLADSRGDISLFWQETRAAKSYLAFHHFTAAGNPGLLKTPALISREEDNVLRYIVLPLSGNTRFVAWQTLKKELRYQLIDAKGTLKFSAPLMLAPSLKGERVSLEAIEGQDSSVIALWLNRVKAKDYLFVQKVNSAGKIQWGKAGKIAAKRPVQSLNSAMTTDKFGNLFVSWIERVEADRQPAVYVYAQRFNASGTAVWDSLGSLIQRSPEPEKSYLSVISDRKQGMYAIFRAGKKSFAKINAQRVYAENKGVSLFTEFTASNRGNDIELTWKTLNESMAKAYRVEKFILKSINDTAWSEVATVPARPLHVSNEYKYSFAPDADGVYFLRVLLLSEGVVSAVSEIEKVSYLRDEGNQVVLLQNTPNPFSDSTVIRYYLPYSMDVRIELYNSRIELLKEFYFESQQRGRNSLALSAAELSPGIYFYRFKAGGVVEVKKCVVTKD